MARKYHTRRCPGARNISSYRADGIKKYSLWDYASLTPNPSSLPDPAFEF